MRLQVKGKNVELSQALKQKILDDNPRRFYGL